MPYLVNFYSEPPINLFHCNFCFCVFVFLITCGQGNLMFWKMLAVKELCKILISWFKKVKRGPKKTPFLYIPGFKTQFCWILQGQ